MLFYLSGHSRAISYAGCVSQLFFYHFLGCTECFLYTVMAYDRFVAICHPLRYQVVMSPRACAVLASGTSLFGCVQATFLTTLTFQLPYCGPNEVDYFFCDIPVMLKLACADTAALEMVGFVSVGLMPLSCFLLILTSYSRIVYSILQIRSSEGRRRAFSTCSAHLTAILLSFMPVALIYLRPTSDPWLDATVQVLNNLVTPMLNPLIYSLRNKEDQRAAQEPARPTSPAVCVPPARVGSRPCSCRGDGLCPVAQPARLKAFSALLLLAPQETIA